uniref:Uncharacterized protein n=1 Tax=Noctiluca scintillans TaxID=2966 RepID=A0A7S1ALB8_NOCSC|mmetsp:Transcript_51083/g.136279  ORF Transcript_51083/g.136279 Transcript_51083/m.136279 type:complete len:452 (+) Transcript_51083:74-1429(+)|eukprot:CAMPEP_0194502388 /NCGR_PEP_ID=MMETSP0253-20130528/25597_1 /TAXON_ID=2966 /ORGANISM="Noctiluca scintillans" /LENGTH=451 /DNA_ID=CAMNT_0039344539 /DNA_START=69 /DNA_END=1424 /DNA_ORIENTATION=+
MKELAIVALSVLVGVSISGCGGGGSTPTPTPSPTPVPTPSPTLPSPKVAPDPATWTYRVPDASNFNCITEEDLPSQTKQYGFFMYRWASKAEADDQDVSSDDLGDINPYYFLTELMTNTGDHPLASQDGGCHISQCGQNSDECVLERIYIKYNTALIGELTHQGTFSQFLNIDNGIPDYYTYWAFNYSDVDNPDNCQKGVYTQDCNFYFQGGYPIGCQLKSDVLDDPVWYSLIGGCPKYPWDKTSASPRKVDPNFVWQNKLDKANPDVAACWREMPGGNNCDNGSGDPFTGPSSKTCTWKALKAGYLDVKDILNIADTFTSYTEWCKVSPEAQYGYGNGIPSNMTFFYNLSSEAYPVLATVTNLQWHTAAGADTKQLNPEAKAIFQNFAKYAKIRLDQMFEAMDKQAFATFTALGKTDPTGRPYVGCKSNNDVSAPPCNNFVSKKESEVVV